MEQRSLAYLTPLATVVAGAMIAAAVFATPRWQITANPSGFVRLDQWGGHVTVCTIAPGQTLRTTNAYSLTCDPPK